MSDTYTVTTHKSWLGRLGNSLAGVLVGLIMLIGAIVLLSWNEGRAVDAAVALDAGAALVVSVPADAVDPGNEGRLIHLSGLTTTTGPLTDPAFRITAEGALRLDRQVEMYQWHESKETRTEKSVGGGETTTTTYSYTKDWSSDPIESHEFARPQGHTNPSMPYQGLTIDARGARLGAFTLGAGQIEQIDAFEPLPPDHAAAVPAGFRWMDTVLYRGATPDDPQLGDLRVSFQTVPNQTVSVVAAQIGATLAGFQGERGYLVELTQTGVHSAAAMFEQAKFDEAVLTWIMRAVGYVVMLIGVALMVGPIVWLASVLPFLGSIASVASVGLAFLVATPLTLATIAVAWLAYRPLIAVGLIVGAAVLVVVIKRMAPNRTLA